MLKASPTRPGLRPRTGKKLLFHYAHHSERGIVEGELEGDDKEKIKAAMQETLVGWRLTLRLFICSRAPTTRARCLEHASRALHGLLGIPWTS